MYISPLERMKKIHIWTGYFSGNGDEFENYFNQEIPPCQFCTDIDMDEYDEDYIGIIPLFEEKVGVQYLLDKVPVDVDDISKVLEACKNKGIKEDNAIFYLTDSSVSIKNSEKDYNELKYLGLYNSSL
jgi:hypothetical protein